MSGRLTTVLWAIWNLAVAALLVSTAFTRYPGLHHDSALYATPIVNVAAHGTWEIESFVPSLISDSGTVFSRHGQLYQWLMGRVFQCTSYEKILAWAAVLNTAMFVSTLLLSRRILDRHQPSLALLFSSGIAAMTALISLWVQGRPEHIVPLLMLAPFAAHEWSRTRPYARHAGYVVLGLVVITSPLTGVLCCLGTVGWIGLRYRHRFIRETALCAGISLCTALLSLLIICPVNPWQWVLNTTQASSGTPSNLGAFFTHLTDDLPLWNLIVLGSMFLLLTGLARQRMAWLGLLLAGVFVSLLWKLQVYVLAGFVPAMMLAIASRHGSESLRLPRFMSAVPRLMTGVVSLTSIATLARIGLLALVFSREGVSFAETSKAVRELQSHLPEGEAVGFFWIARPSFVAFGEAGRGLISIEPDVLQNQPDNYLLAYEHQQKRKVRYVLLPQHGYLMPPPPPPQELAGGTFALVNNGWTTQPAKLGGFTLADSMPGYQFALYKRTD